MQKKKGGGEMMSKHVQPMKQYSSDLCLTSFTIISIKYSGNSIFKEIWYNKIPDITNFFLWSQWINLLFLVLCYDYWYNKIYDTV